MKIAGNKETLIGAIELFSSLDFAPFEGMVSGASVVMALTKPVEIVQMGYGFGTVMTEKLDETEWHSLGSMAITASEEVSFQTVILRQH